jgi:molybdopterin synthase sulfur carrier subunit
MRSEAKMVITVKFVGALRHASGVNTHTIGIKECSVKELICRISGRLPELRRSLIDGEPEDLRPNALVLVNGKEISVLDGLETAVRDGDEVVFVPVVHGG